MGRLFTRTTEDFICQRCGTRVAGNGYTNHCPACLWSKHVDVHPGDRAASCGGMMRPEELVLEGSERSIVHICERCGHKKKNIVADNDDENALIALSSGTYMV